MNKARFFIARRNTLDFPVGIFNLRINDIGMQTECRVGTIEEAARKLEPMAGGLDYEMHWDSHPDDESLNQYLLRAQAAGFIAIPSSGSEQNLSGLLDALTRLLVGEINSFSFNTPGGSIEVTELKYLRSYDFFQDIRSLSENTAVVITPSGGMFKFLLSPVSHNKEQEQQRSL